MHTLELTLLLIFTPLPPTLQEKYYPSSHFTDEESEPGPQHFYVIKHRFSSWGKGNRINSSVCQGRLTHSHKEMGLQQTCQASAQHLVPEGPGSPNRLRDLSLKM